MHYGLWRHQANKPYRWLTGHRAGVEGRVTYRRPVCSLPTGERDAQCLRSPACAQAPSWVFANRSSLNPQHERMFPPVSLVRSRGPAPPRPGQPRAVLGTQRSQRWAPRPPRAAELSPRGRLLGAGAPSTRNIGSEDAGGIRARHGLPSAAEGDGARVLPVCALASGQPGSGKVTRRGEQESWGGAAGGGGGRADGEAYQVGRTLRTWRL